MICECTQKECVPKSGCLEFTKTGKCSHRKESFFAQWEKAISEMELR